MKLKLVTGHSELITSDSKCLCLGSSSQPRAVKVPTGIYSGAVVDSATNLFKQSEGQKQILQLDSKMHDASAVRIKCFPSVSVIVKIIFHL